MASKVPPHDKNAEQSVLGAILIDPSAITTIAEIIGAESFYFDTHTKIFLAMMSLFEKRQPIDLVTISSELKDLGYLKTIGGAEYIAELIDMVPTSAHIEQYARIVKSDYVKRTLIGLGSKLVEKSFDESAEIKSLLDFAESEIFALSQAYLHRDFVELRSILAESFDRLEKLSKEGAGLRGLPTGFTDMDKKLAGMHNSNLIILAARPGVGKTTMALNIALHVALQARAPVGIFSLEMSQEELVDRLLVGQADIDAWRLKTGKLTDDDYSRITEAMGDLSEAPIYIDDTPGASVLEMRTKARKLKLEKGLKLLIIDYLQLVDPGKRIEGRVQEVSFISQQLKNIARELKIPVIALSQLSRAIEHRGDKKPQLADLRESGCLTGDTLIPLADSGESVPISQLVGAQNVWIWSVDDKYVIKPKKALKIFKTGIKQVYELKFRSGRKIRATANHKFMKATDWVRLDEMKVGEKYAVCEYHRVENTPIIWDKLVQITKGEVEDVYDITVPETHSFVANDIVVHNSIEQDADVVMFIYSEKDRDELLDETMRPMKVFLAKHRNGAIGEFDLMFRGDRVKFFDMT